MVTVTVPSGGAPAYQDPAFGGGDITYTNVNGGSNFPTGVKVVVSIAQASSNITGVLVGGNAATKIGGVNDGTSTLDMYFYDCGSGVSDTVVIQGAGGGSHIGTNIEYLTGAATGAPSNTANYTTTGGSDDCVSNLTVPSGGIGIGAAALINGGAAGNPPTWSAGTRDASSTKNTTPFQEISIGHISASGNLGVVGGNPYFFGSGRTFSASWASGTTPATHLRYHKA